jgi:O-antigen/teichoic acid export membrane protein
MARETSRDRATGRAAPSATLLRSGNQALLLAGGLLGALLIIGSPWLSSFLSLPVEFIVAVAIGMPVTLGLPLLLGELQGQQRFLSFSCLNVGQALLKLAGAMAVGLVLGPVGVLLGLALAGAFCYGAAFVLLRRKLAVRVRTSWLRPALGYLGVVLPSTLALAVLLSADVLLVKHFFSSREAGEYSAVAALGRAIFWGAAGVAVVLFPKVIFHESQGRSGLRIVGISLVVVALGGVISLVVLTLVAKPVLAAFAGPAYAAGASILPLYAIAMTLLGGASVLIATHQSRARAAFLFVLLPITVAEPVLIVAFHQSLGQVVWVVTLSMGVLLVGLGTLMLRQAVRGPSDEALPILAMVEAQA